jgi:hypothetical protein
MSIMSFGADDEKNDEDQDARNHVIKLTSKTCVNGKYFKLFREDELPYLTKTHKKTGGIILDFDMSKLEMEYDYDTDKE